VSRLLALNAIFRAFVLDAPQICCHKILLTLKVKILQGSSTMDIVFKEKKFENECNSQRLLKKQYGEKMAKKIRQRLDDLKHD
jgi:hypothetical protein